MQGSVDMFFFSLCELFFQAQLTSIRLASEIDPRVFIERSANMVNWIVFIIVNKNLASRHYLMLVVDRRRDEPNIEEWMFK